MNLHVIKYYFVRYKGAIAFLLLAAATAYSIQLATTGLNHQREVRANDIIASLAKGAVDGCVSANAVAQGVHKVVVGSYSNSISSLATFVKEGTLTETQAVRIRKQSRKQTRQYLIDLPYRDCASAAERYVVQITDDKQRLRVRKETTAISDSALRARRLAEPKLGK